MVYFKYLHLVTLGGYTCVGIWKYIPYIPISWGDCIGLMYFSCNYQTNPHRCHKSPQTFTAGGDPVVAFFGSLPGSHQRHRSTAQLPQPHGASRQSAQGVSAVSWSAPRGCGAHGWMIPGKEIYPGRWTWKLRIQPWKRWNIFQTTIFRLYVNPWDVMVGFKVCTYDPSSLGVKFQPSVCGS